ncbi:hypothetical protein NERG_01583 [Nematocida ausubeli]|uniref:Uncharacterized protein n=1 Tax=Nematocida ausubeli (strain ATCC PRA-371 / ERTm2) TaxID=1913371 RepID=H8ZDB2_NEMA1|nr:hypothetical protein NERG_01583 [Nematocida ausubeli]
MVFPITGEFIIVHVHYGLHPSAHYSLNMHFPLAVIFLYFCLIEVDKAYEWARGAELLFKDWVQRIIRHSADNYYFMLFISMHLCSACILSIKNSLLYDI